jgi:hypothetical protein
MAINYTKSRATASRAPKPHRPLKSSSILEHAENTRPSLPDSWLDLIGRQ